MQKNTFIVDYMYSQPGSSNNRTRVQGSVNITLKSAQSDFAVEEFLKQKHPGYNINIMSIVWM